MGDEETTELTALSNLAKSLPDPIQTGFLKALSSLLGGLTAIPAAWAKRPAQAVDDTTAARSAVAAMLATGVAEEALNDPEVMQAAAEVFLPTSIQKARNRVQVAQLAIEHASGAETDGAEAAAPDDDWMNVFNRFAEDASSERLQDMFGRILAGQVVRQGSFSMATLRTVMELDKSIAEDFSLVWAKSVGRAVDCSPEFRIGEWFSRQQRLAEAGLMAAAMTTQFPPVFKPNINGDGQWCVMQTEGTFLNVFFAENSKATWDHVAFTRVGREIGSILAPPDYGANMREAGQRLALKGVMRIELQVSGKPVEQLHPKPA